jgi:holo-[acyl-carrier protein] synthase
MILGIGCDLVDVARIERQLTHDGTHFAGDLFTASEIAYCQSKAHPAAHFAARFAVKESVVKALSDCGLSGLFWREIEVINRSNGKPEVVLHGRLRAAAEEMHIRAIFVSLSHTRTAAMASVIIEG